MLLVINKLLARSQETASAIRLREAIKITFQLSAPLEITQPSVFWGLSPILGTRQLQNSELLSLKVMGIQSWGTKWASGGFSFLAMEGCRYSDRSHYANNRKVPSLEFPHLHLHCHLLRQSKPQLTEGKKEGGKKKNKHKKKNTQTFSCWCQLEEFGVLRCVCVCGQPK